MTNYTVTVHFILASIGKQSLRATGRVLYAGNVDGSAPDLALVRLAGCPGRRLGWFVLDDRDSVVGDVIEMPS